MTNAKRWGGRSPVADSWRRSELDQVEALLASKTAARRDSSSRIRANLSATVFYRPAPTHPFRIRTPAKAPGVAFASPSEAEDQRALSKARMVIEIRRPSRR